jgi:aspartate/methionine/tyrosine aminotransferase
MISDTASGSLRLLRAPGSGIVEVMNRGRLRGGVIPLWAGEGDLPTPDFISRAAADALIAGETFYTWQSGIPELREALSRYYTRHFSADIPARRCVVTGSGMQAIQLAIQAVCDPGTEAIYLSPAWPNFAAAAGLAGVHAKPVQLESIDGAWKLDLDKLASAITPSARAIFINTPANPTGWTATEDELRSVLALARHHGLWIIADEIYALFHFAEGRAASFLDVATPDDQIVYVNSFSKNWAMTGWRVGWVVVPDTMAVKFENLVQYSTSGVAQFLQRAAVVALDAGDAFIEAQIARASKSLDIVQTRLRATNRVQSIPPRGAFYYFFSVDGVTDAKAAAFTLVDDHGVGLAPGTAFGPGGERFLRLCFNRDPAQVEQATDRIHDWIMSI